MLFKKIIAFLLVLSFHLYFRRFHYLHTLSSFLFAAYCFILPTHQYPLYCPTVAAPHWIRACLRTFGSENMEVRLVFKICSVFLYTKRHVIMVSCLHLCSLLAGRLVGFKFCNQAVLSGTVSLWRRERAYERRTLRSEGCCYHF